MNIVLWFIVILIHAVFAEINHQNELSVPTGSNTTYTNEDYSPTRKIYSLTTEKVQTKSSWTQNSTLRTEIEDDFLITTKDVGSKNNYQNKLEQEERLNEDSDVSLKKDNAIDESGVFRDIKNTDVSSAPLLNTTVFRRSTQEKQYSIVENTLAAIDLSTLASTDSSSITNVEEIKNFNEKNQYLEDTEPTSTNLNQFSTSSSSDITIDSKILIEEQLNTATHSNRRISDNLFSSILNITVGKSSQDSTTEKETLSFSPINHEAISLTDLVSSTSPEYTSTFPVSSTDISTTSAEKPFLPRDCKLPGVNFSNIDPYAFNVTLEWEAPDTTCTNIEYIILLNDSEYNTTDLTITIENLYACSIYTVSIATADESNIGPKSEETFNTSVPDTFSTYGVRNLSIEKNSEGSLDLTWEPPIEEVLQCVTNYYLTWWDADTGESVDSVNITENSYNLPLVGCMQYGLILYPQSGAQYNGHEEPANYTAPSIPFNNSIVGAQHGKTDAKITWEIDKTKNRCDLEAIFITCNAPADQNFNASWIIRNAEVSKEITTQTHDNRYPVTIGNLSAFTNYTCTGVTKNAGGNSTGTIFEVSTDEDVPSEPMALTIIDITPTSFTIKWQEPYMIPGIMTSYGLKIFSDNRQFNPTKECSNNVTDHHFGVNAEVTNFTFQDAVPYYQYVVSIYGIDGAGNGTPATMAALTASAEPDNVTNAQTEPPIYSESETYYGTVKVTFDPPCNTNGPFKHYEINYNGVRDGFSVDKGTETTNETATEVNLLPERTYSISVTVVTEDFTSSPVSVPPIHSQAGVPIQIKNMTAPTTDGTVKASFMLAKGVFSNENGDIIAYSLILMTTSTRNSSYGFWDGTNETWPSLPKNERQLTPNFWNPFNDTVQSVQFIIGSDGECSKQNYCNQALNEGTKYWLIVRALTSAGYKDSSLLHFETEMTYPVGLALILGLIFGLLVLVTLIGFLIFLWRRNRRKSITEEEKRPSTKTSSAPIPVQKFLSYYAIINEDNNNIVKQQFMDLGSLSKEFGGEISYANLPENKRKNRYTNILPFDSTRVSLKIDEDDEICSDYINASYIKGYTGKVEYIATQGPLESTARDFWKMILQENVTIIAMVSQFVEQTKEKCFHYFPNNHESVYFGESLEVKCSTELHFGTYCVRTLQVRKNSEQRDVVHMQFLEWPDFGVPQGTDNMLQFCNQLREKVNKEGGLIAVHCSAGVGRTGTLIAMDILLQTIDDHRDINIYKTVFDLRKQRTNMVQTEKQYMFIYTCIKDYIETPPTPTNDVGGERIYENIDVLRTSSLKKNLIESEIESAL